MLPCFCHITHSFVDHNDCFVPCPGPPVPCPGEVPVPDVADRVCRQLGDLRAVLLLHRAVPRTRMSEQHSEFGFLSVKRAAVTS